MVIVFLIVCLVLYLYGFYVLKKVKPDEVPLVALWLVGLTVMAILGFVYG